MLKIKIKNKKAKLFLCITRLVYERWIDKMKLLSLGERKEKELKIYS